MTRVTRLPGDHSQVGWLPPSSVPYHYSEKDSSPLTRGKLAARQRRVPQAGFIPAHAGKTRWLRARSPPKRAHSRSRGENVDWFRSYLLPVLIPAHAGKTMPPTASLEAHRAHPRSRGENVGDFASGPGGQGSSPLTRGKRANAHRGFLTVRLIPAHAGKTSTSPPTGMCSRAHPRSRGENTQSAFTCSLGHGSSPLTRGKLSVFLSVVDGSRLIPAHAGKTTAWERRLVMLRAHPRSRGENRWRACTQSGASGSSPLTRGKLRAVF